eukprot:6456801-Amphidinium_carterae.2
MQASCIYHYLVLLRVGDQPCREVIGEQLRIWILSKFSDACKASFVSPPQQTALLCSLHTSPAQTHKYMQPNTIKAQFQHALLTLRA